MSIKENKQKFKLEKIKINSLIPENKELQGDIYLVKLYSSDMEGIDWLYSGLEGYLGIVIGLFIIKSGFEVLKESISSMIGNRFEKEIIDNMKKDIIKIDGVNGAYDLILNSYGYNKNIGSIHISVSDELTAREIQQIERAISTLAQEKYQTILTVGIYAENNDKDSLIVKKELKAIIKKYPTILQFHGFYLDIKNNICNFDLVISFDDNKPYETIQNVKKEIEEKFQYDFIIQYDQDFSLS